MTGFVLERYRSCQRGAGPRAARPTGHEPVTHGQRPDTPCGQQGEGVWITSVDCGQPCGQSRVRALKTAARRGITHRLCVDWHRSGESGYPPRGPGVDRLSTGCTDTFSARRRANPGLSTLSTDPDTETDSPHPFLKENVEDNAARVDNTSRADPRQVPSPRIGPAALVGRCRTRSAESRRSADARAVVPGTRCPGWNPAVRAGCPRHAFEAA